MTKEDVIPGKAENWNEMSKTQKKNHKRKYERQRQRIPCAQQPHGKKVHQACVNHTCARCCIRTVDCVCPHHIQCGVCRKDASKACASKRCRSCCEDVTCPDNRHRRKQDMANNNQTKPKTNAMVLAHCIIEKDKEYLTLKMSVKDLGNLLNENIKKVKILEERNKNMEDELKLTNERNRKLDDDDKDDKDEDVEEEEKEKEKEEKEKEEGRRQRRGRGRQRKLRRRQEEEEEEERHIRKERKERKERCKGVKRNTPLNLKLNLNELFLRLHCSFGLEKHNRWSISNSTGVILYVHDAPILSRMSVRWTKVTSPAEKLRQAEIHRKEMKAKKNETMIRKNGKNGKSGVKV